MRWMVVTTMLCMVLTFIQMDIGSRIGGPQMESLALWAKALTSDFNEVLTVVNGANGVLLPNVAPGTQIVVRDGQGAVALLVYPPSGQSIDVSATNGAISIGGNATKTFRKFTSTKWYSQ